METGDETLVKSAAEVVKDVCYNYRDQMTAGMIIGGWDARRGGQVYAIPIGGMIVRQAVAIGGSGSSYIYGFVDASFKEGMQQDDCVEFVKKCESVCKKSVSVTSDPKLSAIQIIEWYRISGLGLAIARDGSSGGVIRIGVITKDGVKRLVFTPTMNEYPKFYEG